MALAILACCLFILAGCHHKIVSGRRLDRRAVTRVGKRVSEIRGLAFLEPIRLRLTRTGQLRKSAASEASASRLSGRARRESALLAMLGLVPFGADPAEAVQSIVSSQPAGLYLPGASRLEIVQRDFMRSEVAEIAGLLLGRDLTFDEIVAHELTHALQEQHFGLDPPGPARENGDAALAHVALAEGDATLVGFQLGVGGLVTSAEKFVEFARRQAPDMGAGVPSYFQERFKFPYLDGTGFALALRKQGGLSALDRALRSPPLSSEQVMHPQKYLGGYDPPRIPDLSGIGAHAGEFSLIHEDTLGEFGVGMLLSAGDPGSARRRAAGWGGDRAAVFERRRGGGLMLVWVLDFDTQPDAADFLDGLDALLSKRHGQPDHVSRLESRWTSGERLRHLELWEHRVVLVDAPRGTGIYPLVQAAWRAGVDRLDPVEPGSETAESRKPLAPEEVFRLDPSPPPPARRPPGPLVRIGSGSNALTLGSFLQIRGQRGGEQGGMAVQRLRARATGTAHALLDLTMQLEFELAEPEAGLLDAVISFTPVSANLLYLGHLRLGRFRVPYSRSVLVDPELLPLNRRTLGAEHLSPRRRTGLCYDLDLGRHGFPLRLRAGAFDGFPEAEGQGPLWVVRLDFTPSAWLDSPLELTLGAAYHHDNLHQEEGFDPFHDAWGLTLDARAALGGFHLSGEITLQDRTAPEDLESQALTAELGAFLLPDFLQLVGRYEALKLPQESLRQLTAGINLLYLAHRFMMSYNFIWQPKQNAPDQIHHLMAFQLLI